MNDFGIESNFHLEIYGFSKYRSVTPCFNNSNRKQHTKNNVTKSMALFSAWYRKKIRDFGKRAFIFVFKTVLTVFFFSFLSQ